MNGSWQYGLILEMTGWRVWQLFLIGITFVYFTAFASFYFQIRGLYGPNGVLPVDQYLKCPSHDVSECFKKTPTLVWFASDIGLNAQYLMELIAFGGIVISTLGLLYPSFLTIPVLGTLWFFYQSLYQVGQTFLWFQWDLLLLESGFLAIFVSPLRSSDWRTVKRNPIAMALVKWLMFRLMFASGVVKLTSGCPLWWSLKALNVHYESQCLPTPAAWLFHQLPEWFQKLSVVATFVIEIALPFLFYAPTKQLRRAAFYGQILLMGMIMVTGNYNFFNIVTCVLAVSVLDDDPPKRRKNDWSFWNIFSRGITLAVTCLIVLLTVHFFGLRITESGAIESSIEFNYSEFMDFVSLGTRISILLGGGSLFLSIARELWHAKSSVLKVVKILGAAIIAVMLFLLSLSNYTHVDDATHESLWPELHRISAKFSNLHVFGSYGLFRRMTGANGRPELVLEGANNFNGPWEELEFKYKPGDLAYAPKYCLPYQPRLDWQMWFAALGTYHNNPWLMSLAYRILTGENNVYQLLDIERRSSFNPQNPPKFIRGTLYTYTYTRWNESNSNWWERREASSYFPVFTSDHQPLIDYLKRIKQLFKPRTRN